jgi:hypothetical protein
MILMFGFKFEIIESLTFSEGGKIISEDWRIKELIDFRKNDMVHGFEQTSQVSQETSFSFLQKRQS